MTGKKNTMNEIKDYIIIIACQDGGGEEAYGPMTQEDAFRIAAQTNVARNLPTGEPSPGKVARVFWLNPTLPEVRLMLVDTQTAMDRLFPRAPSDD